MSDEQPPPSCYMDALMGAGGKRERAQAAHTGMTPPAKAASPNHLGGSEEEANIESEAVGPMEDLRMDDSEPPQWSAGEEDEGLLKEAPESSISQIETTETAEPSQSGAKRNLAAQYENLNQQNNGKAKRRREDSRIYAINLSPRDLMQLKGKSIPPIAATKAIAMELVNVWGESPKILKGGAEKTQYRNIFRVGLDEENMVHRMCLRYAKERDASIHITHKPLKGDHKQETVIPYFRTRDLHPPTGFREETITLEIFASADYDITDKDIMTALKAINLEAKGKIHRPSVGKECPVKSNKRIVHVVPPGHTSKAGGKWTLIEAASMFK